MSNSFFMLLERSIFTFIIIIVVVCILFIPPLSFDNANFSSNNGNSFLIDTSEYLWPTVLSMSYRVPAARTNLLPDHQL